MLPVGHYQARAVEGGLGLTSKGAEQVAVVFEILDQEHAGQRITWYGYFTDKTEEGTIRALRTCGWTGDDLTNLAGIGNNEVTLVVEHEKDDKGQVRARVRWVNGQGGLQLKTPMPEAKAKAFAARMRGRIHALDKSEGARPASSRREPPPMDEPPPDAAGEDIPF